MGDVLSLVTALRLSVPVSLDSPAMEAAPMQVGSLPGRGSCVEVRGAVEPSPGADARDSWGWGYG